MKINNVAGFRTLICFFAYENGKLTSIFWTKGENLKKYVNQWK